MRPAIYLSSVLFALFCRNGLGCEVSTDKLIVKSYSNVDDYKATFVETTAGNINSDLDGFAKIIFLTEGQIPEICKGMFQLSDLEVLQMNYMGVAEIEPDAFNLDDLPTLRTINLKANNLTKIGVNLFRGLQIKFLMLTSNKIDYIHVDAFDSMPNLEILSLEDNKIARINPDWFKGTKNIRILSLESNQLTYVPKRAFIHLNSSLESYKKFFLNHNKIELVDSLAFENIEYFEVLELSHNRLTYLPHNLFSNARAVRYLELDYNNIRVTATDVKTYVKVDNLSFLGNNVVECSFIREFLSYPYKNITSKAMCTPVEDTNKL